MNKPSENSDRHRGIAALFNDTERKDLFRKYLYFLGWVELLILLTCWLYQIGDTAGNDGSSSFPWRLYFAVAFLTPIGITFLIGTIIVGFNKYFGEAEGVLPHSPEAGATEQGTGRIQQLHRMVTWVQRLPFLALLLLLSLGVGFFYKLDAIVALIGRIGEKSVRAVFIAGGIILIALSVFALILIVLNYKLRKKAMEYQYKSQVAERFGLIILEDNTVMNSSGKLLVNGKKWKDAVQLLPEPVKEGDTSESSGAGTVPRPVDMET